MNVLVIGGAGYIGSHVVHELSRAGHEITVFDNLSSGLRQNLLPDAAFVHGDILHYPALRRAMQAGFDAVFHFAAFKAAGESMALPEKYSVNNLTGTINILNAMCETSPRILVFSSSAAIYGSPEYLPLDESHPANPENFYGFTKLEIERMLAWYDRLKGIKCAALRYFNAAGYDINGRVTGLEQNPANLMPVIMEAACGRRENLVIFGNDYDTPDGTAIRDYIHVNDLATGHLQALDSIVKTNRSLTVNLATGVGHSVLDVYHKACEVTGVDIPMEIGPRRLGDPPALYATAAHAKERLGFVPRYSDLDTLLRSMWQVYQPVATERNRRNNS
ncbi:UDP-glucose 4-epimerase GalE [candidate division KSB3 bacterium]|uniref:UDP-glucose 4-epimerase n=1 Tax=candidate division KSB3 bacterium TaxID=2044937 RepID=A0A9D5JWL8_9BACT|nr:UDP-glucose 4-epimerase GalE [candidate division KSB3 bacterium]MBD3325311.1 UDP-glucose 4-epimerase GalE [candidate division KSB3 bacterium]